MNGKIKNLIFLVIVAVLMSGMNWAQGLEPTKQEVESILSRFINYRFGTVSVFKIKNPSDVKRALRTKSEVGAGKKEAEDELKKIDPVIASIIKRGAEAGDPCDKIREEILNQGYIPPEASLFDKICGGLKSGGATLDQVENAYIVTTRQEKGQIPSTIIALITSDRAGDDIEKNLRSRGTADIYTFDEMKQFRLDTSFSSPNLYELMLNAIMQGNIENKTLEAQGIGNVEWFSPKVHGKSYSLISKEADVDNYDIQKFLRISDGQALDYFAKGNELIVSPDLISWKKYKVPLRDDKGTLIVDSAVSTNEDLPEFGVELRYGMDNISYPSFWSERLSLSALWQSVKLGFVLPTSGWSSLTKDVYSIDRKLTNGGVGITGSFDFPFKVIPQSGVFHFDFDYVFGDAKEATYKNRNIDPQTYVENRFDNDYLVRTNMQLHYTFGVAIDADYWFRFGIGTSFYNVEKWYNKLNINTDSTERTVGFSKLGSESIFGISGKIEFMAKNILTPFGASVEYFDESIGGCIWLQIPIIKNTLALRLDAKGYFVAFRDKAHDWENKSVFMPMARFIINF